MILTSGWFEVTDSLSKQVKTRWCIVENGVLWMFKKPGSSEGKDGLPLHDAVVGECNPPVHLQLAIRCRRSGRVLALKATSKDEYSRWMVILSDMARLWSDKRRASILNKQLMAIALENESNKEESVYYSEIDPLPQESHKFAPRRKSEIIQHDSAITSIEEKLHNAKYIRKTLKEIVEATEDLSQLRWAKLHEVQQSGLLGVLEEEHVALEELKFAALIEEFRFMDELKNLIHLATRAVSWNDPAVPAYHRRAIVNSLHKVKKSSAVVLRMAERHWSQKVTMQNAIFTLLGHEARVAAWQQTYTEYCSHLSELRSVFNRSRFTRPEMEEKIFSKKYDLELALVPLQHLTSQRQLIQTIFELLSPGSAEFSSARGTRDFLNEILDSCYQELTELDGSEYVAEMDNALHFDLSKINPIAPGPKLLPRQSIKPPAINANDDEDEERILKKMAKAKSRPSIMFGALTNAVRRFTSEGSALNERRRASMPAFEYPTAQSDSSESENEAEHDEAVVVIPQKTPIDEYEPGKVVPRFFIGEPFYQDYLLAIAEENAEKLLQRGMNEDSVYEVVHSFEEKGCTQWFNNFKVQISGLLGKLSDDERELASILYELVASEAAYLKSLRTLDLHFVRNTDFYDDAVLSPEDRHFLFSGTADHIANSQRLLYAMEGCWEKDLLLNELCSIIHNNAISSSARALTSACYNQRIVAPTLKRLMENLEFSEALIRMENSHVCGRHSLLSYLTLPIKRLGRVKLLLDAMKSILAKMDDPEKMGLRATCESAHAAVDRLITRAELGAKKALSDQSLQTLASRLSFNRIPSLALNAEGRLLVHHGDWRILGRRENGRGAFKPKVPQKELLAFLLTDILLLVDPLASSSTGRLEVFEYSARSDIQLRTIGPGCQEPMPGYLSNDPAAKNSLYLSFRDQSGKLVEMVIGCDNPADKARWLGATRDESNSSRPSPPPRRRRPAILKAVKAYSPSLPDELMLTPGDIIALSRNPGNGWVQGKCVLDGFSGWFPKELTVQLCAGRKSVTFLVDEDDQPPHYATIAFTNRSSVA
ncbi:rho guanine nucleotide exchange factor 26-like [Neocloeon triangulifer]|uniref:rho guanine nucleotide exchange factor 26-like n=1 Tax=Neocloeon triangulifer TaxID=2078957 RepID=UPI00286F64B7|nr:rho guanine nucleotide exchange factor 26-like [Neocloeon triangulifer]XP_059480653.1 rho guanine nucleotide exchange factor 26-like [Neocloeon triangulifer]